MDKGSLFFVGPTGVGKTELAKAMAEFMFGDVSSFIRFDMSEYNHEHSDQKLIGAPPGYVGFEQGGQLTPHMNRFLPWQDQEVFEIHTSGNQLMFTGFPDSKDVVWMKEILGYTNSIEGAQR